LHRLASANYGQGLSASFLGSIFKETSINFGAPSDPALIASVSSLVLLAKVGTGASGFSFVLQAFLVGVPCCYSML
jgi:hypothetical protein